MKIDGIISIIQFQGALGSLEFKFIRLLNITFAYLWSNCYHSFWYFVFVAGKTKRT